MLNTTRAYFVLMPFTLLFPANVAHPQEPEEFHPKQLDHLEFFIESISGIVLATNTSQEAYENTAELTPNDKVWTNQEQFPQGTVRWWWDQSPQGVPTRRGNKPFKTGRSFGQDDHDRPGYIPDGCNGKPAVRGALVPGRRAGQT